MATDRKYEIIDGWLCEVADGCTCGTGGLPGHLPGCGYTEILPIEEVMEMLTSPLAVIARRVREVNLANGWDQPIDTPTEQVAVIALIGTEVSEAIEEVRDGHGLADVRYSHSNVQPYDPSEPRNPDGSLRKPEGVPSELADIIIRVLDIAARPEPAIDIDAAVIEKIAYNSWRGHRHGGKAL